MPSIPPDFPTSFKKLSTSGSFSNEKSPEELTMAQTNMKPVEEFREGTNKAAVFHRTMKDKNNKEFLSQTVALQVSYTDKDGNWINNNLHIIRSNLSKVIKVLNDAQAYMNGGGN